jgi:hypothetical protein
VRPAAVAGGCTEQRHLIKVDRQEHATSIAVHSRSERSADQALKRGVQQRRVNGIAVGVCGFGKLNGAQRLGVTYA